MFFVNMFYQTCDVVKDFAAVNASKNYQNFQCTVKALQITNLRVTQVI